MCGEPSLSRTKLCLCGQMVSPYHAIFECPALAGHFKSHTTTIAFRHLPPNSTRFSYATEGALFISAQLSSDAVSALRKVRVLT